MNDKPMIKVNRRLLMAWVDGILLDRDSDGRCLVTDDKRLEAKFEAAEKAMDAGEVIYLTDDSGVPITKMYLAEDGYTEEAIPAVARASLEHEE